MKTLILGIAVLALLLTMPENRSVSASATCVASASCRACKNCNYCGHCAKKGGTCGVCRPKKK
ncbi:MAG TPA: hypothetical protein VK747_12330 [Blastocatellia bacterium]|nr:hypothetical protein [Blastocatellia bacterium]